MFYPFFMLKKDRTAYQKPSFTRQDKNTRVKGLKTEPELSGVVVSDELYKFLFEYSGHFCFCKHNKTLSIFENIPQQTRSGGRNLELPEYSVSYLENFCVWHEVPSGLCKVGIYSCRSGPGPCHSVPVLKACGAKPSCSEHDHIHQGANPRS